MTPTPQTEAQRLASTYNPDAVFIPHGWAADATKELRRLDTLVANLQADVAHKDRVIEQRSEEANRYFRERDELRAQLKHAQQTIERVMLQRDQQFDKTQAALTEVERLQGREAVTVTAKLGDLCSFHSSSVRKGDKLYTELKG